MQNNASPVSAPAPSPARVSAERIESALGNPTPRPVPENMRTSVREQRVRLEVRGCCNGRFPTLSHLVMVEIGDEGLVTLAFTPDQAEVFAAALLEHAKYTRAAAAWLDAEAAK